MMIAAFLPATAVHFRKRLAIERTVLSLVGLKVKVTSWPFVETGSCHVFLEVDPLVCHGSSKTSLYTTQLPAERNGRLGTTPNVDTVREITRLRCVTVTRWRF
ncbi:hypothetical protein CA13_61880 [Planctomycetes bacterium CA13]|uniref:Uncharacterized protein n=1 Tax=Novipirellula herctigrandis TaxID=2527986 RepID=A0A5C5ZC41_9BACT|nr:hypothetical protein CA13_61880 [Planctomycetes bacterium CA13]